MIVSVASQRTQQTRINITGQTKREMKALLPEPKPSSSRKRELLPTWLICGAVCCTFFSITSQRSRIPCFDFFVCALALRILRNDEIKHQNQQGHKLREAILRSPSAVVEDVIDVHQNLLVHVLLLLQRGRRRSGACVREPSARAEV
jgi:hypothetical protein